MKRIALAAVAFALGTGAVCAKDLWNAEQIKLVAETANKMYAAQANPQMSFEMVPAESSAKMLMKFSDDSGFGAQWDNMNDEQKKLISDMMVKQVCGSLSTGNADQDILSHVEFIDLELANADASKVFTSLKVTDELCAAAK